MDRDRPQRAPSLPEIDQGRHGSSYLDQSVAVKRRSPWRVVFVVAVVVLVASLVALGLIAFSYFQGQQKYSSLAADVGAGDAGGSAQGEDLSLFTRIDWDALLAINPDTVAWVSMPGTAIDYPVVRGDDNEYYLTHDFYGDEGWLADFGAIFMDYRNVADWADDAYFIYGHHMNDGSMFAGIASLADPSRFAENRTIYLWSPQGSFRLRSFALIHCDADDPLVQIMFSSPAERTAYVQDKIDRSIVRADDAPSADAIGQVFAFATCDNRSAGRYVLYAYVEESTVQDDSSAPGSQPPGEAVTDAPAG